MVGLPGQRPEPDAPRQRLLIVGDSATAGVGVGHQREALASLLASRLAEAGPATIEWRLIARRGATIADVLRLLDESLAPRAQVDIAVVAVGVNDVTGQAPLRRWLLEMEALVQRLERRHGARLLVVSGLPPMHLFAALPQPLRWYLGACARRYDAYRARVKADPDGKANFEFAQQGRFILREERTFVRTVEGTFNLSARSS